MDRAPKMTTEDFDKELDAIRKERMQEDGRLAGFGVPVNSGIYEEPEYVSSIPASESDTRREHDRAWSSSFRSGPKGRSKRSITAPQQFLDDIVKDSDEPDPFADYKAKKIIDRENEYKRRRYEREWSPVRSDPWSSDFKGKKGQNSYAQRMKDQNLEKEHQRVLREVEKLKQGQEEEEREKRRKGEQERRRRAVRREVEAKMERKEAKRKAKRAKLGGANNSIDDGPSDPLVGISAASLIGPNGGYTEPPDAAVPTGEYTLVVLKGGVNFGSPIVLSGQSAFRVGRHEENDIVTLHGSCSKAHAVVQFRIHDDGTGKIKPYIVDLKSTNGTTLNGTALEPMKLFPLKEGDAIQFGCSTRTYILQNRSC